MVIDKFITCIEAKIEGPHFENADPFMTFEKNVDRDSGSYDKTVQIWILKMQYRFAVIYETLSTSLIKHQCDVCVQSASRCL